jgi:hypothetical protein
VWYSVEGFGYIQLDCRHSVFPFCHS